MCRPADDDTDTDANANVKGKIQGRAVPRRVGSAASHPASVTCLLLQLGTPDLPLWHFIISGNDTLATATAFFS